MARRKPDVREGARPERASSYLRATIVLGVEELSAIQREALESLMADQPGWFLETTGPDWGPAELARGAAEAGAELLVAAGGDGTVSAVAGVLAALHVEGAEGVPPMAILPFGTANDFARTLAVHELDEALAAIGAARRHRIDAIGVRFADDSERYVVNVANGGLAWDIAESLDDARKSTWGPLAYARGALDVIGARQVHRVAIQVDDGMAERFDALTVAVSSGRTCGGGLRLAPTADPEDGLLEVTVLRDISTAQVATLAARMRLRPITVDAALERFRGRKVTFDSDPPMRFVLDGELVDPQPVTFEVVPGAVELLVGREYVREPALAD